jgi:hypothetical protein
VADSLQLETLGLPIDTAVCFSTVKNVFSKRIMKRQLKTLKPLAPLLKQFLDPDETILVAARATSPHSTLAAVTTGAYIHYVKRCILVVTSRRILHIPTRPDFSPKQSIAQALYGDIAAIKFRGFLGRDVRLTYKSGRKERFSSIPSRDFKKLKAVLGAFPREGPPTPARERHHLCPKCMSPLAKGRYACTVCRLEFKNREVAMRRALLIPGGGWFYTGHTILGVLYALIETLLLLDIVLGLVLMFTGQDEAGGSRHVIFPVLLLALEKILSMHHVGQSLDEYIPADADFVPIKSHSR